ncbi:MAG: UvrD-helicase domain-containing protein [Steroidobacteraceae bacterium]
MSDAAIRELALDPSRSILLQAPAGSGKTTVLAQRFLGLLAQVDEPEELLAITFTRKAAAEMRERVLLALEGGLDAAGPVGATWSRLRAAALAQAARRGWPLDELGARLRIQTIDSLNHEIARAMPVLGRFQGSLQVVDDATALYRTAARRTLRLIDADAALQPDADVLLERLDNNLQRAEELIADLLDARASWLPLMVDNRPEGLAAAVVASLERIVTESLEETARLLPPSLLAEAAALLQDSARHREAAGHAPDRWRLWLQPQTTLAAQAPALAAWQTMADLALTAAGTLRRQITVAAGFPPHEKQLKNRWKEWMEELAAVEDCEDILRRLRALPQAQLGDTDRAATAALARILIVAAAELQLVFREQGRVDHAEVAATARQALIAEGQPTELAIRHTLRIRHLLVDEFQDVSPTQVELIAALTAGWSRGDGRSLFLVGDPMQSIYLFRHSEVGLFLRTRMHGIGAVPLEALQLRSNFRSRPELVQWANEVFAACFPRRENLRTSAVGFLASEAARAPGADGPAVQVWPLPGDDAATEAQWIAARIREQQATAPQQRIAILVRDRRLAPPLLDALREAGIAVRGVALASLAQHQTVLDLVALGAALLHAGDRTAWLAVLRAPACGLLLADLAALAGEDADALLVSRLADPASWARVSEDGRRRLQRAAPLLVSAWRNRQRAQLPDAIETLWRALGGEALAGEAQRHAAAQYLGALRRLLRDDPAVDGHALRKLAARLRDTPAAAAAEGTPPVEVLTIHHAKGLEWDVVFVPGIGQPAPPDRAPLMRYLELPAADEHQDLLLAVHSIGATADSDALSAYIRNLQQERQRNEQLRLAYVAFTRARERLVLTAWAARDPHSGEARPDMRSLLGRLWPALRRSFAPVEATTDTPTPSAAAPVPPVYPLLRSTTDFDPHVNRRPLGTLPSLDAGSDETLERPEFTWVGPQARAEGTVVHAVLEAIARSGDWNLLESPQLLAGVQRQLRQLGLPETRAAAVATDVLARLRNLRDDPRARWLLSPGHRESHCELRLTGLADGRLRNIIIDRSFVDEAGQRWVVDYKTSTHGGGDLAGFLASELARYRPQLQLYRALAARLGPEPVRAALYFPWLREWVELDHSPASENG